MLSPGTHVILNFIAILYFTKGNVLLKNEGKSFERDFQMCMDNFVVNTDIIIRTQDSRKLGAKYLNDMDVETQHDCKRFCCETDMCDVFVYEEKKTGSCYLFHCGPPHDFKCKFTNHSSYSSAILTIANPQQTLQIEEQIRRIKQEHELKSLRKMSASASLEYPITEATPVITHIPKLAPLTTPVVNKTVCSRNQYECKSTKECIAIYNVCDGIPQCADGSDESADLGCPTEKPTAAPQPLLPRPIFPVIPEVSNYQQMIPHHKSYVPMYDHAVDQDNIKSWQAQNSLHQMAPPQQQNMQYPVDNIMISQQQMNAGYPRYQWNYPYYDPNKETYDNLNVPHTQNKLFPYEQEQPRIFHHKRPGISNENEERNPYEGKSFIPYYVPSNREGWPDDQQIRMEPQAETHPIPPKVNSRLKSQDKLLPAELPLEPQPEIQPEFRPEVPEVRPELKPKSMAESPPKPRIESKTQSLPEQKIEPHPTVAPQIEISVTDIAKVMKSMPNSPNCNVAAEQPSISTKVVKSDVKVEATETVKSKPSKSPKGEKVVETKPQENNQLAKRKEEIHKESSYKKLEEKMISVPEHFRLENNENERMRPKGAVISLALGLTVTAIMAVLIACRLRVVRRRGRRRHEPYAHDADYLVNGMYL